MDTSSPGSQLDLLSWNIGYAGLGREADFFMDGGTQSADEKQRAPLPQGDRRRHRGRLWIWSCSRRWTQLRRTYSIDERPLLDQGTSYHALNYSCPFVPVPVPPIGKVHSGLLTMTRLPESTGRAYLSPPCPFSWPLRIANLKRCLLVSYLPIEGSDKQLVLVNLHLEAYDSGEGKIAQTGSCGSSSRGVREGQLRDRRRRLQPGLPRQPGALSQ